MLDATGVSFNGQTGATASLTQAYAIEDKITDYLDDATLGYVSIKTGYVYVAQSSETPNAGAIQRGINVAQSGNTVNVQAGTFVGQVTISQSVILLGANSGNDPTIVGSRCGNRHHAEHLRGEPLRRERSHYPYHCDRQQCDHRGIPV